MWYYVKQSMLSFVYLFFTAMTAIAIATIGDNLIWLKVVLGILNVGLYGVIIAAASFKDGQNALKVRMANDLERMQIIKTGEDRPLKLKEEYKPWKGFLTGFITCVPLLVLLILHTILILVLGDAYTGAGITASIIYMMFYLFARVNSAVPVTPGLFYWMLFALPFMMLLTGIPYILGARKIQLQQDAIKAKQRQIYGE